MQGKEVKQMDLRAVWEIKWGGLGYAKGKKRGAVQRGARFLTCTTVPFADRETPRTRPSFWEDVKFSIEKMSLRYLLITQVGKACEVSVDRS